MALREETEKPLEEVYQRNLQYPECFTKEKSPELYGMCKNCIQRVKMQQSLWMISCWNYGMRILRGQPAKRPRECYHV